MTSPVNLYSKLHSTVLCPSTGEVCELLKENKKLHYKYQPSLSLIRTLLAFLHE